MTKPVKTLLSVAVLCIMGIVMFYPRKSEEELVEGLLQESRESFGEPFQFGQKDPQDEFFDSLINAKAYDYALSVLDTIDIHTQYFHNYRGLIFMQKRHYKDAIKEFTSVLPYNKYHNAKGYRASAYVKVGLLDSAVRDYMEIYAHNHSFSLPLAETYELKGEKDSAKKYYLIYLDRYPDSLSVRRRLERL